MTTHEQLKEAMASHPSRDLIHTRPLTRKVSIWRSLPSREACMGFLVPFLWGVYCTLCFTGHVIT